MDETRMTAAIPPGGGEERAEDERRMEHGEGVLLGQGDAPAADADPQAGPAGSGEEDRSGEDTGGSVPADGDASEQGEIPEDEPDGETESSPEEPSQGQENETPAEEAVKKISGWKRSDKHPYCTLICDHLTRRCREDKGFALDLLKESKTFGGCFAFITKNARKMASGNCAAIEAHVVYEWAEDYIRSDEEKEPQKAASTETKKSSKSTKNAQKRNKSAGSNTKNAQSAAEQIQPKDPEPKSKKPKAQEAGTEEEKPAVEKRKSKEKPKAPKAEKPKKEKKPKDAGMDGQMDLFSLFG